jgi:DedD protein
MANKDDLLNLNTKKTVKKPLVYGAVAFLVFIIAILGFAIYSNSASKQENVVLPPQIQQQKQDTMFKEVPIEEEKKKQDTDTLADKLINNEKNATEQKSEPAEKPVENAKTQKQTEKNTASVNSADKKVKAKTEKPAVLSGEKYYVQVAALMKYKKPNKKFLAIISKEGYKYRLYKTYYVKDGKKIEVTKILIGPFGKKQVREELKKIRNNITQNAFVYKVK